MPVYQSMLKPLPTVTAPCEQLITLDGLNTVLNLENKGIIPVVEVSEYFTVIPNLQPIPTVRSPMREQPLGCEIVTPCVEKFSPTHVQSEPTQTSPVSPQNIDINQYCMCSPSAEPKVKQTVRFFAFSLLAFPSVAPSELS